MQRESGESLFLRLLGIIKNRFPVLALVENLIKKGMSENVSEAALSQEEDHGSKHIVKIVPKGKTRTIRPGKVPGKLGSESPCCPVIEKSILRRMDPRPDSAADIPRSVRVVPELRRRRKRPRLIEAGCYAERRCNRETKRRLPLQQESHDENKDGDHLPYIKSLRCQHIAFFFFMALQMVLHFFRYRAG